MRRLSLSLLAKNKLIFHQNNERMQTWVAAKAKFNNLSYILFPYSPYFPDSAFSVYFLFPKMKKRFIENKFGSRIKDRQQILLFRSGQNIGETLDEVYRGRMLNEKLVFHSNFTVSLSHPRLYLDLLGRKSFRYEWNDLTVSKLIK